MSDSSVFVAVVVGLFLGLVAILLFGGIVRKRTKAAINKLKGENLWLKVINSEKGFATCPVEDFVQIRPPKSKIEKKEDHDGTTNNNEDGTTTNNNEGGTPQKKEKTSPVSPHMMKDTYPPLFALLGTKWSYVHWNRCNRFQCRNGYGTFTIDCVDLGQGSDLFLIPGIEHMQVDNCNIGGFGNDPDDGDFRLVGQYNAKTGRLIWREVYDELTQVGENRLIFTGEAYFVLIDEKKADPVRHSGLLALENPFEKALVPFEKALNPFEKAFQKEKPSDENWIFKDEPHNMMSVDQFYPNQDRPEVVCKEWFLKRQSSLCKSEYEALQIMKTKTVTISEGGTDLWGNHVRGGKEPSEGSKHRGEGDTTSEKSHSSGGTLRPDRADALLPDDRIPTHNSLLFGADISEKRSSRNLSDVEMQMLENESGGTKKMRSGGLADENVRHENVWRDNSKTKSEHSHRQSVGSRHSRNMQNAQPAKQASFGASEHVPQHAQNFW